MEKKKVLVTELYPIVEKALSDKNNVRYIQQYIGKFFDKNMGALSTIGPTRNVSFSKDIVNGLYDTVGLTEDQIKKAIKESDSIDNTWVIATNPLYTLCTLIARYFLVKNDDKNLILTTSFMTFVMYAMRFKHFFKYNPIENVMSYTISNLSNRFDIKKEGSVYATYINTTKTCLTNHNTGLKRLDDRDYVLFVNDLHSRIGKKLREIANEYYKNYKEGNYLNVDQDYEDEDSIMESDNVSFLVARIVSKNMSRFETSGIYYKGIKLASEYNKISELEMRNLLVLIHSGKHNKDVEELISAILLIYLFDLKKKPETIRSASFLTNMMFVFGKMTKQNENLNKIRELLTHFVSKTSIAKKTKREATLNAYKKALYMYMLFFIQDNY